MLLLITTTVGAWTPPPVAVLEDEPREAGRFFVQLHGGAQLPFGPGTRHPFAEGVASPTLDYFGAGGAGELTLALRGRAEEFLDPGLRLWAGTARLGTAEWRNWAAAQGDIVESRASMTTLGLSASLGRIVGWRLRIDAIGGLAVALPRGQETLVEQGRTFDYNFLKPALGGEGGLEIGYGVSEHYGFSARVVYRTFPGLVDYEPDGSPEAVNMVLFQLGIEGMATW